MTGDLASRTRCSALAPGIFFIGYFLLQIPGTMLVEVWSARKFIGASLIVWGGLATLTGFIHTAQQFYWIRFFLGAAEAGFFPGVIVYLTHWYRYEDRSKAVAMFMIAIPMSNMLGAVIGRISDAHRLAGLAGWRWLLILEGIPAVVAGVRGVLLLDRLAAGRGMAAAGRTRVDHARNSSAERRAQEERRKS